MLVLALAGCRPVSEEPAAEAKQPPGDKPAAETDESLSGGWSRTELLQGHANSVASLAFSPDGSLLASGSQDSTLRLWSTTDWTEVARMEGFKGSISSLAFSPDGRYLATGSLGCTAQIWNVQSHERVALIETGRAVYAVDYSPDGAYVAAVTSGPGEEGLVNLYSSPSGELVREIVADLKYVFGAGFHPTEKLIAVAGYSGELWLYDYPDGRLVSQTEGHENGAYRVAFSASGKLATSGGDGEAVVWEVPGWGVERVFKGHRYRPHALAFTPDSALLGVASLEKWVRIWDVETGEISAVLEGDSAEALYLAFSPDGLMLATGGRDHAIRIFSRSTAEENGASSP